MWKSVSFRDWLVCYWHKEPRGRLHKEIGEMQKDTEQNQCPVFGKQLETEVKWSQQILI